MFGGYWSTLLIGQVKKSFEKGCRPLVIGIGKRGTTNIPETKMIEKPVSHTKALGRVPETGSTGYLHKHECHKLIPTGKFSGLSAGPVFFSKVPKSMSRNKFEQLMKNCVTVSHVLNPLSCWCVIAMTHHNTKVRFRPFLFQLTGH